MHVYTHSYKYTAVTYIHIYVDTKWVDASREMTDTYMHHISSFQSLSRVRLFVTPWDCNMPGIYIDGRYMHTEIYISVYMYIYLHRWQIHTYIYGTSLVAQW